jgi:hypothetical protein
MDGVHHRDRLAMIVVDMAVVVVIIDRVEVVKLNVQIIESKLTI